MKESFTEESSTVSSDITSEADDTVSLKTAEIVNTESQDSCESLPFQLLQAQEKTARFDEEVSILKEKLGNTKAQLRNAQAEIKHQLEENGELKSRMFCMFNLSGDESISFYTGIVMTRASLVMYVFTISAVSRETVSSASDVMSLLTVDDSSVNDSFTRRLLFFGENLADGGGLFRGEVRHANFEGTVVMYVYTHLPSSKAFFEFASTKMQ